MTGCDTCDRHGPEPDTTWVAWLNLHRALHQFWWALTAPLHRLIDRTTP